MLLRAGCVYEEDGPVAILAQAFFSIFKIPRMIPWSMKLLSCYITMDFLQAQVAFDALGSSEDRIDVNVAMEHGFHGLDGAVPAGDDADAEADDDECEKGYAALAKAWNRSKGLRYGDRVVQEDDACKRRRVHKHKWIFENIIDSSWKCVRRRLGSTGNVGETKRHSDSLSGMAALHHGAIRGESETAMATTDLSNGLVITSGHDATPRSVYFGVYADQMVDFAKYLVQKENEPGFKLVSSSEVRALRGQHWKPKYGIVEFFAQRHTVHWNPYSSDFKCMLNRTDHIISKPMILKKNNASTVHTAQQRGSGMFSFDRLNDLSLRARFVFWSEVIDSCNVNKRKLRKAMKVFLTLPANCFLHVGSCGSHLLHIILQDGADEALIIGDIYCAENISQIPAQFNRIVQGFRVWLRRHMRFFKGV